MLYVGGVRSLAAAEDDEGSKQHEVEDNKLLGEYYVKFKGPNEDKNYHLIPKFYSKVSFLSDLLVDKVRQSHMPHNR